MFGGTHYICVRSWFDTGTRKIKIGNIENPIKRIILNMQLKEYVEIYPNLFVHKMFINICVPLTLLNRSNQISEIEWLRYLGFVDSDD